MLKAEFRFFLDDSMPFLNFHIRVGHTAVPIKKLRDWLAVLVYFFSRLKSCKKKKRALGNQALDHIPDLFLSFTTGTYHGFPIEL